MLFELCSFQEATFILHFTSYILSCVAFTSCVPDEIMDKITEAGFQVAMQKEMQLSKEQAEEFYKEHRDLPYFDELTERMSR